MTLHIVEHVLKPCTGKNYKAAGRIVLSAEVADFGIWDEVKERLDGMTIHTVSDMAEALISAAQRRAKKAEKAMMKSNEESRQEVEKLGVELAFTQRKLEEEGNKAEMYANRVMELEEVIRGLDMMLESNG